MSGRSLASLPDLKQFRGVRSDQGILNDGEDYFVTKCHTQDTHATTGQWEWVTRINTYKIIGGRGEGGGTVARTVSPVSPTCIF